MTSVSTQGGTSTPMSSAEKGPCGLLQRADLDYVDLHVKTTKAQLQKMALKGKLIDGQVLTVW